MSKQDRSRVRTAEDLERKYNFAGMQKAIKLNEVGLNKTNGEMENFVNVVIGTIGNLQNQIDGKVDTWYYKGVPSLSTLPAADWSEDEYPAHVGDLYYDQETGIAYKFMHSNGKYVWERTTDKTAEALAIANAAKDTADAKRRIFTEQPIPPYDVGDLWLKGKEIYICQTSASEGEDFQTKDFVAATDYATNSDLNKLAQLLDEQARVILVLKSNSITTENLHAAVAKLGFVDADAIESLIGSFGYITADNANLEYARLDKTNIKKAWIEDLLVNGGILTDEITSAVGSFTNYLTGVKILGDLIEANTLKADALILKGADGIYRRLNIDALGETVVGDDEKYNKGLDGSILVAESVTAAKMNVDKLSAISSDIGTILAGLIRSVSLETVSIETREGTIGGFVIEPSGLKTDYEYVFALYDHQDNAFSARIPIKQYEGDSHVGLLTDFIDIKLLDRLLINTIEPKIDWNIPEFKVADGNYYIKDITNIELELVLVYSNDGTTLGMATAVSLTEGDKEVTSFSSYYKYVAIGYRVKATGYRYSASSTSGTYGTYYIDFLSDELGNMDVTTVALGSTYKPKLTIYANQDGNVEINPLIFRYGDFIVNSFGDMLIDDSELETLWATNMK